MSLYPLKFIPRFLEKLWGGRKVETVLGKTLPPGRNIGESWEIYDFPPGVVDGSGEWVSSVIANGPLAGRSLHWAMQEFGRDLLGDIAPVGPHGQFPLLVKFLDAREDLSVQVHPDKAYADMHPEAHLKTEAWYVVEHSPGARLFKGLRPGSTAEGFRSAISSGTVEEHLIAIPVKEGQCFYLPSGTVHALGAGILAAEVQTPSDTTFRVYDFNRVEPATGKTRMLHVEQAMQCIDFSGAPEPQQTRSHVGGFFTTVTRLVTSPHFKMEKVRFVEGVEEAVPYDEPVIWVMLEGEAQVKVDGLKEPVRFGLGETVLLPAAMKNAVIKTLSNCVWLEITFPKAADLP
ncbi:MAG TPA: type I phosphomannose isomerase catalytic subunit [Tepidisphaeraceae bacterium]|jgi:mannose-6-phosphate isomerase|nr:type I phosphomannose isomerase catalytic subunit [Tepidisphaeraceae bacterium]